MTTDPEITAAEALKRSFPRAKVDPRPWGCVATVKTAAGTMSLVVERYSASWSARSHIAARWGEIEDITGPSDTAAEAVDKLAEAIRARAEYMRETADAMLATLADGEGES